jgi:hypothetical protein
LDFHPRWRVFWVCFFAWSWSSAGLHQPARRCRIGQTSIRMLGWTNQHRMLASHVHLLFYCWAEHTMSNPVHDTTS